MLLRYCSLLVIIIVLNIQIDLTYGGFCLCSCHRYNICHELSNLEVSVNANVADRQKWSRYYDFVRNLHNWRWKETEEEIKKLQAQNLEAAKQSSRLTEEIINSSKAISSISTRNEELENKIWSRLQLVGDLTEQLKNDLQKEREARKKLEDDSNKMETISRRNEELKNQISEVQEKLRAVEYRAVTVEADLQREQNARKTLEDGYRRTRIVERKNEELEYKISGVEAKLRDADRRAMIFESDLKKEREARQRLEASSNHKLSDTEKIQTEIKELKKRIEKLEDKETQNIKDISAAVDDMKTKFLQMQDELRIRRVASETSYQQNIKHLEEMNFQTKSELLLKIRVVENRTVEAQKELEKKSLEMRNLSLKIKNAESRSFQVSYGLTKEQDVVDDMKTKLLHMQDELRIVQEDNEKSYEENKKYLEEMNLRVKTELLMKFKVVENKTVEAQKELEKKSLEIKNFSLNIKNIENRSFQVSDGLIKLQEYVHKTFALKVQFLEKTQAELLLKIKEMEKQTSNVTDKFLSNIKDIEIRLIEVPELSVKVNDTRRLLSDTKILLLGKIEETENELKNQLASELQEKELGRKRIVEQENTVNITGLCQEIAVETIQNNMHSISQAVEGFLFENHLRNIYHRLHVIKKEDFKKVDIVLRNLRTKVEDCVTTDEFSTLSRDFRSLNNITISVYHTVESEVLPRIEMLERKSGRL